MRESREELGSVLGLLKPLGTNIGRCQRTRSSSENAQMVGKRRRFVRRRPGRPRSERGGPSGWQRSPWVWAGGRGTATGGTSCILYPRASGQKNQEGKFIRTETEGESDFVVSAFAFVVSLEQVCSRGSDRYCSRKPSNTYYKRRPLCGTDHLSISLPPFRSPRTHCATPL